MSQILEEVSKTISDILSVKSENIEIRQDAEYMVAEVRITGECIGTQDDMDQIFEKTQFKWDSFRVNPMVGIVLVFVSRLDYTPDLT